MAPPENSPPPGVPDPNAGVDVEGAVPPNENVLSGGFGAPNNPVPGVVDVDGAPPPNMDEVGWVAVDDGAPNRPVDGCVDVPNPPAAPPPNAVDGCCVEGAVVDPNPNDDDDGNAGAAGGCVDDAPNGVAADDEPNSGVDGCCGAVDVPNPVLPGVELPNGVALDVPNPPDPNGLGAVVAVVVELEPKPNEGAADC